MYSSSDFEHLFIRYKAEGVLQGEFNVLLSTCRMNGLSALEYLKKFFREVVNGCRDDENLLPMTIGLTTNHV